MEAERGLKTWGKPQGRELVQFQNQLRLAFLREDWAAISTIAEPQLRARNQQHADRSWLQRDGRLLRPPACTLAKTPGLSGANARVSMDFLPSLLFW
jgi:hypothetical protein